MKKYNSEFYTYRVIWSKEDEEYVGLCSEFPRLSYLHRDMTKALKVILNLVPSTMDDMIKNNESIPAKACDTLLDQLENEELNIIDDGRSKQKHIKVNLDDL